MVGNMPPAPGLARANDSPERSSVRACNRVDLSADGGIFLLLLMKEIDHEIAAALPKCQRRNRANITHVSLVPPVGCCVSACRLKHRIFSPVGVDVKALDKLST